MVLVFVAIALKLLPVFTQEKKGQYFCSEGCITPSQSPSSSYCFHTIVFFLSSLTLPHRWCYLCRNRPQALTCFHTLRKKPEFHLGFFFCRNRPQALTCFHTDNIKRIWTEPVVKGRNRPQALTCFHTSSRSFWVNKLDKVAIALKLLPVFTQFLFLMQETCAFLNSKILTSLSNPF